MWRVWKHASLGPRLQLHERRLLNSCSTRCTSIWPCAQLAVTGHQPRSATAHLGAMATSSAGDAVMAGDPCQPAAEEQVDPRPASPVPAKKATCNAEQFFALDLRAGTILTARLNPKACQPAYVIEIDLGPLGTVTSSAQLVANYAAEDLVGRQVVVVANLPPRRIAGVQSEVLVLGTMSPDQGTLLLSPDVRAADGAPIG